MGQDDPESGGRKSMRSTMMGRSQQQRCRWRELETAFTQAAMRKAKQPAMPLGVGRRMMPDDDISTPDEPAIRSM